MQEHDYKDVFLFVEAMKSHLLQWFHEKNRKIQDGYDYEVM